MAGAFTTLSDAMKRELEEAAKGGIAKLKDFIKNKNSEWKKIPLNIGITGQAGVGKSSFINTIRGITAEDEGGAHVDVVEATIEIKPYKHPINENMIFWDLPGVGSPKFPRDKYLDLVNFERFDFFIIMSASRFRDDDLWLAVEIRKLNKNFHFIRTQIGLEIEKDKQSHPKTHEKSKVIEKIRRDCLENLAKVKLKEASVFLIDNYAPLDFEFNDLASTLIDEAPERKKEAMTLSMSLLTHDVLKKKIEALSNRILKVSIVSAIGGAIPIPVVGALIDGALMLEEVIFYKQQLGLDAKTMEDNARLLKTDARELEKKLCLRSLTIAGTAKGLVQGASCAIADEAIESALPIAIPVIGSFVSAGVSYGVTVSALKYYLKLCSEDTFKINEELMRNALN
ncbi:interferon-inducible GTPase 5-like [Mercenaria mercenaria]|uniref:interferon-inducible GTPase 5-like n=1 Tax=Mercenaria mercenaria TaxID=6596 RepID=UPI00234EECD5|nr:interferon-inducible GTPase 5-like [Mercenaria mercenaria]